MNVLYKFYCRTYQSVLRMALPFLPYREPKIIYNKEEITNYLKVKNYKKLLFVTDERIRKHGVTKEMEDYMVSSGFQLFVYDETRANPTVENVECALKIYKDEKCEAIIAMGGGSSMDLAKGAGIRVTILIRV